MFCLQLNGPVTGDTYKWGLGGLIRGGLLYLQLEILTIPLTDSVNCESFSGPNIHHGHTNAVNVLLQYGANVAHTDKSGRTALHFAAGSSDNSCEILRCLIENGTDIDKGRNDNQIPLMVAAQKGHVSVATFLIEHGANVDLQDENGNTALHHTLYGSDVSCEILSCLTGSGADVNGVNKVKHTPLMIAAKRGHLNALTLLIKHGAHDVDLQDSDGYTALRGGSRGRVQGVRTPPPPR